ncbi:hypothetical protein CVT24_013408, partial [Panaeolus cyanescens]
MASTILGFKTYIPGTIPLDLAHLLSIGLGLTYVGSLYLSKGARLSFRSGKKGTGKGRRVKVRGVGKGRVGGGGGNGGKDGEDEDGEEEEEEQEEELRERQKYDDERWRDDPDVIRARLAAVSGATVVCCLGVGVLVGYVGGQAEG